MKEGKKGRRYSYQKDAGIKAPQAVFEDHNGEGTKKGLLKYAYDDKADDIKDGERARHKKTAYSGRDQSDCFKYHEQYASCGDGFKTAYLFHILPM